jgi:hypothetical protein
MIHRGTFFFSWSARSDIPFPLLSQRYQKWTKYLAIISLFVYIRNVLTNFGPMIAVKISFVCALYLVVSMYARLLQAYPIVQGCQHPSAVLPSISGVPYALGWDIDSCGPFFSYLSDRVQPCYLVCDSGYYADASSAFSNSAFWCESETASSSYPCSLNSNLALQCDGCTDYPFYSANVGCDNVSSVCLPTTEYCGVSAVPGDPHSVLYTAASPRNFSYLTCNKCLVPSIPSDFATNVVMLNSKTSVSTGNIYQASFGCAGGYFGSPSLIECQSMCDPSIPGLLNSSSALCSPNGGGVWTGSWPSCNVCVPPYVLPGVTLDLVSGSIDAPYQFLATCVDDLSYVQLISCNSTSGVWDLLTIPCNFTVSSTPVATPSITAASTPSKSGTPSATTSYFGTPSNSMTAFPTSLSDGPRAVISFGMLFISSDPSSFTNTSRLLPICTSCLVGLRSFVYSAMIQYANCSLCSVQINSMKIQFYPTSFLDSRSPVNTVPIGVFNQRLLNEGDLSGERVLQNVYRIYFQISIEVYMPFSTLLDSSSILGTYSAVNAAISSFHTNVNTLSTSPSFFTFQNTLIQNSLGLYYLWFLGNVTTKFNPAFMSILPVSDTSSSSSSSTILAIAVGVILGGAVVVVVIFSTVRSLYSSKNQIRNILGSVRLRSKRAISSIMGSMNDNPSSEILAKVNQILSTSPNAELTTSMPSAISVQRRSKAISNETSIMQAAEANISLALSGKDDGVEAETKSSPKEHGSVNRRSSWESNFINFHKNSPASTSPRGNLPQLPSISSPVSATIPHVAYAIALERERSFSGDDSPSAILYDPVVGAYVYNDRTVETIPPRTRTSSLSRAPPTRPTSPTKVNSSSSAINVAVSTGSIMMMNPGKHRRVRSSKHMPPVPSSRRVPRPTYKEEDADSE